jgi:hypothetical protein
VAIAPETHRPRQPGRTSERPVAAGRNPGGGQADNKPQIALGGAAIGQRGSGYAAQRIASAFQGSRRQNQPAICRKGKSEQIAQHQCCECGQQRMKHAAALQGMTDGN